MSNRAERRRQQREVNKARQREKLPNKTPSYNQQRAEQQAIDRAFAITRRTLEKEFGFGKKRLNRFIHAAMEVSRETRGGTTLVQEGRTLDEIEEGKHAYKQKEHPRQ